MLQVLLRIVISVFRLLEINTKTDFDLRIEMYENIIQTASKI